jgi:type VI secretion system secreted protein Hcp
MATRIFLLLNSTPPAPGEALDLANAIELQSFSWGVENDTTIGSPGGGAGTGKAKLQPLMVVKRPDSASSMLFQAVATGEHFQRASIVVVTPGANGAAGQTLRYDFNLVFATRFVAMGSQGERPLEEISLVYGAVILR